MIDEQKLYPLSCLRGLKSKHASKLASAGVILIKQLLEEDPLKLARRARLQQSVVREIVARAKSGLDEFEPS